jgi:hypothetical protein
MFSSARRDAYLDAFTSRGAGSGAPRVWVFRARVVELDAEDDRRGSV